MYLKKINFSFCHSEYWSWLSINTQSDFSLQVKKNKKECQWISLEKHNYNLVDISPILVLVNKPLLNNSNNIFWNSSPLSWSWMELVKCFHLQRHSTCQPASTFYISDLTRTSFLRYWLLKPTTAWLSSLAFSHLSTRSACSPEEQLRPVHISTRAVGALAQTLCHTASHTDLLWLNLEGWIVIKGCQQARAVNITSVLQKRSIVASCGSPVPLAEQFLWRGWFAFHRGFWGKPVNMLLLLGILWQRNWVLSLNDKSIH